MNFYTFLYLVGFRRYSNAIIDLTIFWSCWRLLNLRSVHIRFLPIGVSIFQFTNDRMVFIWFSALLISIGWDHTLHFNDRGYCNFSWYYNECRPKTTKCYCSGNAERKCSSLFFNISETKTLGNGNSNTLR